MTAFDSDSRIKDIGEVLGRWCQAGFLESPKILPEKVYAVIEQVENEQATFIEQLSGQTDHHLSLAALRFPVNNKRCSASRREIEECPLDRQLDAVDLLSVGYQTRELPLVLWLLVFLLEAGRIKSQLGH